MPERTINELMEAFERASKKDDFAVRAFFEEHEEEIEAIDVSIDPEHKGAKLRMLGEYGFALSMAGYYSKANRYLERAIQLFEEVVDGDRERLKAAPFYENMVWTHGTCLWYEKRIRESTLVFERLHRDHPENDRYRGWLQGLRAERIQFFARPLWIVFFVLVLVHTYVAEEARDARLVLLLLLMVLFLGLLIAELVMYWMRRSLRSQ